jgi:hypothetical protein
MSEEVSVLIESYRRRARCGETRSRAAGMLKKIVKTRSLVGCVKHDACALTGNPHLRSDLAVVSDFVHWPAM